MEAATLKTDDASSVELPDDAEIRAAQQRLDMMLTTGGDERIWPDPVTRRNRYGAPAQPAPEEAWFSSATASAISPRGYAAAGEALARISGERPDLVAWFDDLRARLRDLIGAPDVEIVFTGSEAEAELAALAVAKTLLARPVSNIIVDPGEAGATVDFAALGTHFAASAAFEPHVEKGAPLAGWEEEEVELAEIALRDVEGRRRAAGAIDRDACLTAARVVEDGRDALLHVADMSKTGYCGPSRDIARAIVQSAGERLVVLVDASQLRCSLEQIRKDLADGFLVMITGSAFVGGPAFCGALLIPPDKSKKLRDLRLPAGMAAYAARLDWPESLSGAFGGAPFAPANLGLGLRWSAALAEMEAYADIPANLRDNIVALFAECARRGVAANPDLDFLDAQMWRIAGRPSTIFPVVTHKGDLAQARLIHGALREPCGLDKPEFARVCHLGEPVIIDGRAALRLCLAMPQVTAVAERVAGGADLDKAFLPLRRDIELLFRKWGALAKRISPEGTLTLAASNDI